MTNPPEQPPEQPPATSPAAPHEPAWAPPVPGAPPQQPSQWGSQPVPPQVHLQSLAGLATAVLVLSGFVLLADVAVAATSFQAADTFREATEQGRDPAAIFTAYDGLGILAFVVLIPTWIVGSLWLARARANAAALEPEAMRRSPAWSFLGWVVPIVSFWFPKQIVDDSARVAERATGSRDRLDTGWWWAGWIVYLLLGNVAGRLAFDSGDSATGGVHPGLAVAVAVVGALAFIAWVRVVRGLTAVQEQMVSDPPSPWRS